jgi:eukaryotic-like serine/threonine-protein kinase
METGPEYDRRVMTIARMAMQREPAERDSFVRVACEQDSDLCREVFNVVRGEEAMGGFLLEPVISFRELPRPFEPGQVVAQRFEILRIIGEGGMGIVYEAFDRKRSLRIALKAAKPGYQRLLSPELEGALTVRHPNVCRVNEIHTAQTDHGEVEFITMELLEGQTLHQRILQDRSISDPEASQIARQLCAGLVEAHRSGVIHRDLKPANIMLCPESGDGVRAVITDFGLSVAPAVAGGVAGTPGYMAPEVWKGEQAAGASDVYSLGVILYEMVAGRRPFDEDCTPFQPARIVAPSERMRGLASRWDRVILPCLAPSPDMRPSVAKVQALLEKRPLKKAPFLAIPAMLCSGLLIPQVREWIWPQPSVRLAILPAEGSGSAPETATGWLQDVADRVIQMRSGRRTIAVIPPSAAHDLHVSTPEQAGQLLHATHALQTVVQPDGDGLVTEVSVVDLATQVRLREFSTRYSLANAGAIPAAIAGEVSLALRLRSPEAPDPLAPEARQAYDRGLYYLRRDGESYAEAIAQFQLAVHPDSRSALPWAALAEAQILRYTATRQRDALDDARAALHKAESINPDSMQVRLIAGLLHVTTGQNDQAIEDYRRAQELAPGNPDVLLRVAGLYDLLDEPDKAIENYQHAIALEPGYYAPYYALGVFYFYRGQYPRAIEQFRKAIDTAPGLFDAYTNLGAALNYIGRDQEAEQALLQSLRLKETARALNSLGAIHAYHGEDSEAAKLYQRAIVLNPSNYIYRLNLGDSCRRSRRAKEAALSYRKGIDLALSQLNANGRDALARAYVAYFSARLGERKRAEEEIAQALSLSPADEMVQRKAVLTYLALGKKDQAIELLQRVPAEVVRELYRHPDMSELRHDPRVQQIETTAELGGT